MTTEHCPDHSSALNLKVEGANNSLVLEAGTRFCVKGSTDATGILTADGQTTLVAYLGNGHDVSYYVTYPTASTTTTTQAPTTTTTIPATTTTTGQETFCRPDGNRHRDQDGRFCSPASPQNPSEGPGTACVTPDGFPYRTSLPECPEAVVEVPSGPTPLVELPRTGMGEILLYAAIFLIISGLISVALGKLIGNGSR